MTGTTELIYEGLDPLRSRATEAASRRYRSAAAERLAADLRRATRGMKRRERGSLTAAVYLTQRWLPATQLTLWPSTWDGHRRNVELHLVPNIGRAPLRHLCPTTSSVSTPRSSTRDGSTERVD
jgi:hypothetical protein